MLLTAGLLASTWPSVVTLAHHRADQLVTAGKQASGSEAELDFTLAQVLDPGNQLAADVVAEAWLNQGQPAKAVPVLDRAKADRAGESAATARLYVRALLETDQVPAALAHADVLVRRATTQADVQLAALAYGVGEQPERFAALKGRLDASEAAQRTAAAQSDKLALAQALYATGLLDSSQRVLLRQADSVPRDLLLGRLYSRPAPAGDPAQARDFYAAAAKLDPTNREARQGLITALAATGDHDGAAKQTALQHQLELGQP
jgi:hypothetical protein